MPSEPPVITEANSSTSTSIELKWTEVTRLNGAPLLGYGIIYKRNNENFRREIMKSVPQTPRESELEDLQKFTEYTIRVYAFTRYGNGVASQPILLRTQEDGKLLRLSPICHLSVTYLSRVSNVYTCSTHLSPASSMIVTCLSQVSHMFFTTLCSSHIQVFICHPCIVSPHVRSVQIYNMCQPETTIASGMNFQTSCSL